MAPMRSITLLPSAKVPVIYDGGNTMTTEWYRFFWNIYGFTGTGVVPTDKGGTGLDTIGEHQLIIGNANNVFEPTELVGSGITITYGTGTVTLAIGNSGVTPGTYGSATQVGQFTVDIHGTLTFAQNVPIAIDANQIVSGTIASARISGSYTGITGVGTLTVGTWNATAIGAIYGGTGLTSYTTGDLLYASASNTLSKRAIGTTGYQLTVASGVPTWKPPYVPTTFTATAGQTTFSATYNVGYVQVFLNGVKLNGADFTATNGTSVVLAVAANLNDIVELIASNV